MHYMFLTLAVVAEVIGFSALKASLGFTRLTPSIITVACFILSFSLMALALRVIPVGIAYAIWCGLGVCMITAVGWLAHREALDTPAIIGIALIIAGCLTINLFSGTQTA